MGAKDAFLHHFLMCAVHRIVSTAVLLASSSVACTIIAVGKMASATGSPMVVHSADCGNCDFRLGKVPAKTFSPGAKRDVVQFRLEYPRYVGDDRGDVFTLANTDTSIFNWTNTPSIGQISQVNDTFAYIGAHYGIMNEHQVSMAESTCGGRLVSKPVSDGGKALFDVSELTHIAMERATTARQAIEIMGDLAEKHGYYGATWSGPGAAMSSGEALAVADTNEVWLFHIHPDDTGASAVWVAQRVPDNDIAAIANQFVIHHINLTDRDNFMGSANLVDVAVRAKLYSPQPNEAFDFTKAYAHPIQPDQYYATRRVWRILTLGNPSLKLSPITDIFASDYPISTPVAAPISPTTLLSFLRDHFEGTAFDMTNGLDAGPFGDPDRFDIHANGNMTKETATKGHFERAISIFRSSYSFVTVANGAHPDVGYILFGQYGPHATTYVPIYAKIDKIPMRYSRGSLHRFDPNSNFWTFAIVGNWAARFYTHTRPVVAAVQAQLEASIMEKQATIVAEAQHVIKSQGDQGLRMFLTTTSEAFAETAHESFTELFAHLVTTFHDGYHMQNLSGSTLSAQSLFYPEWWLKNVGYFDKDKVDDTTATFITSNEEASTMLYVGMALLGAFVCVGVGFGVGMYRRQGYHEIN
ncbi:unnamed protein product [Aphanomyces euteiches]|nr:hypothetical protein AeRB84_014857 [Aphanomyces euteiches]